MFFSSLFNHICKRCKSDGNISLNHQPPLITAVRLCLHKRVCVCRKPAVMLRQRELLMAGAGGVGFERTDTILCQHLTYHRIFFFIEFESEINIIEVIYR